MKSLDKKAQEAWELRKSLASAPHLVNMWDTFIEGYKQGYKDNQPKQYLHTTDDLLPTLKYTPEVIDALYGPESLYTIIKEKVLDVGTTVYIVYPAYPKVNGTFICTFEVMEDIITGCNIWYDNNDLSVKYAVKSQLETLPLEPSIDNWWLGGIFLTKEEAQAFADKVNIMYKDED